MMSLYTKGDGLLETHVLWDDIERQMQRVLKTTATFGSNKTIKDISDGKGFISRIGVVHPDWQGDTDTLPSTFAVKMCTLLTHAAYSKKIEEENGIEALSSDDSQDGMIKLVTKLHNVECTIYEKLMETPNANLPLLKIYHLEKYSDKNPTKGYIIMEYLSDVVPLHIPDTFDSKTMSQVLKAVATYQASGYSFSSELKEQLKTEVLTTLFLPMFEGKMVSGLLTIIRKFVGEDYSEKVDRLEEIIKELGTHEYLKFIDDAGLNAGMDRVLCHGDMWSCNMLFNNPENLELAALIDFQTGHFGYASADLCRLCSACLSPEDRRNKYKEYLTEFYGYLEDASKGHKMPYTLEMLISVFEMFLPVQFFLLSSTIAAIGNQIVDGKPEEIREKARVSTMKQIRGMLDDMDYYHRKNMKLLEEDKIKQ